MRNTRALYATSKICYYFLSHNLKQNYKKGGEEVGKKCMTPCFQKLLLYFLPLWSQINQNERGREGGKSCMTQGPYMLLSKISYTLISWSLSFCIPPLKTGSPLKIPHLSLTPFGWATCQWLSWLKVVLIKSCHHHSIYLGRKLDMQCPHQELWQSLHICLPLLWRWESWHRHHIAGAPSRIPHVAQRLRSGGLWLRLLLAHSQQHFPPPQQLSLCTPGQLHVNKTRKIKTWIFSQLMQRMTVNENLLTPNERA